jgi:hypothetical protein
MVAVARKKSPDIDAVLRSRGFGPKTLVDGAAARWDAVKCMLPVGSGIYAFEFTDDSVYVGQGVRLRARLSSHEKAENIADVAAVRCKLVPSELLDSTEKDDIRGIEAAGVRLRNRLWASRPLIDFCAIDEIISPSDQLRWLADLAHGPLGHSVDVSAHLATNPERWQVFPDLPKSMDALARFKEFMLTCVPQPLATQGSFWSVAFTRAGKSGNPRRWRLCASADCMEIFRAELFDERRDWVYFLTVARSLVDLDDLKSRYGASLYSWDQKLRSGGADQITLHVYSSKVAMTLMAEPQVQLACRDMVMRCMRKGMSKYAHCHHPWIVTSAMAKSRRRTS